jgi:hypothetical protein
MLLACGGDAALTTEGEPTSRLSDVPPPIWPALDAGGGGVSATDANAGPPAEPDVAVGDTGSVVEPRERCDAMASVLAVSCGNGSCHTNPGATIGDFAVDLDAATAYVGRVSVRGESCGLVIDPDQPERSLLLTKVSGGYPSGCGGAMPVGSFVITDDQVACLADWIERFGR